MNNKDEHKHKNNTDTSDQFANLKSISNGNMLAIGRLN